MINARKNQLLLLGRIVFLVLLGSPLFSQNAIPKKGEIFTDQVVPRIDISLHHDSLNQLIQRGSQGDNHHYLSTMIFDNGTIRDTIYRVGFRLRGNTSRGSQKKSFKISFNTYEPGRKYHGLEKMNINGEHNDPSIIRSKLCWDILRQIGIPAPRANHIRLYINRQYVGLFINVEHIDEEFVDSRFGNQAGNLYKCTWPATLEYMSPNPSAYQIEMWGRRPYELKTNIAADDYSDLAHFIAVLNNTPAVDFDCELEKIFNVDAYLKVIAFDILSSNWDGPIFNKNNFYLYHNPATGQFEYIPFDLDNTFGIDWFIGNLATRDIYNWKPSNEERPLYARLLSHPTYRDRFSFYMQQLLAEVFLPENLHSYIDSLKAKIDPYIAADAFRTGDYGWSIEDYHASYEASIGQHVKYGLKPYIRDRYASALAQLKLGNILPIIRPIQTSLALPHLPLFFTTKVIDDEWVASVELCYSIGTGETTCLPMILMEDTDTYQVTIGAIEEATSLNYYIKATDRTGQIQHQPVCDQYTLRIPERTIPLFINEVQAKNTTTISDEAGEFDDWIELYNAGEESINLANLYLTDNQERPDKWQLPSMEIAPKSYLSIWADEDQEQGDLHANFKLSGKGEFIGLFEKVMDQFVPIDGFVFGVQTDDQSYGRIPDGADELMVMNPTPTATNGIISSTQDHQTQPIKVAPNPTQRWAQIMLPDNLPTDTYVRGMTIVGQVVFEKTIVQNSLHWDMEHLSNGIYLLQVVSQGQVVGTMKVVKGFYW